MELDFVRWLNDRLPVHPQVEIGVGDDAAVLLWRRPEMVATADMLIDGVHFLTAEHSPERIGRKSLAVNLSDLAAMASRPCAALVSLALPRDGAGGLSARDLAGRLIEGMLPLVEEFGGPIGGGDPNVHGGTLVVSVTVLGERTDRGVVRRSGAEPGDWILVTGELGGSLAGKQFDFQPRVAEAMAMHQRADLHAMMDLSDGLSLDLQRLCSESCVGAFVDTPSIPIAAAAGGDLNRALSDGEDFELLITAEPEEAAQLLAAPPACGLRKIGEIMAGVGIALRHADGSTEPLSPRGYEHR